VGGRVLNKAARALNNIAQFFPATAFWRDRFILHLALSFLETLYLKAAMPNPRDLSSGSGGLDGRQRDYGFAENAVSPASLSRSTIPHPNLFLQSIPPFAGEHDHL
jgi:hypothetical protein